jgi:hypothetical protein
LFLSSQGRQLTTKAYREHYWNPACLKQTSIKQGIGM